MIRSGERLSKASEVKAQELTQMKLEPYARETLGKISSLISDRVSRGFLTLDDLEFPGPAGVGPQVALGIGGLARTAIEAAIRAMGLGWKSSGGPAAISWGNMVAGGIDVGRVLSVTKDPTMVQLALKLLVQLRQELRDGREREEAEKIDVEGFVRGLEPEERERLGLSDAWLATATR
jgi:hypothetical protein